ncbi:oxidoreductase, partial [Mycobacterium tuberculosis KT-0018]
MKVRLDPSRCV